MPSVPHRPRGSRVGFTTVELLVTLAFVAILAATAALAYSRQRVSAYDIAARSDLLHAMIAIEAYRGDTETLPTSPDQLTPVGFRLSSGVSFTKFKREKKKGKKKGGLESVHMHTKHAQSPNTWHANYPAESSNIKKKK